MRDGGKRQKAAAWVSAPHPRQRRTGQDSTESAFCPSLAELDMVQLTITGLATILTLVSVVIYVEEALYIYRKTSCPIKMKTLCWSSSAPTVS